MAVFVGSGATCWLCGGSGQIATGETERLIRCRMCDSMGVSCTAPSTSSEMVAMITAMPGVARHTLTEAEIDAAVAEYGRIIEQALREIEAEET